MLFGPTSCRESQLSSFNSAFPYPFELINEIRVSIVLPVSEFIFPNILNAIPPPTRQSPVNNKALKIGEIRAVLLTSFKFLEVIKLHLNFEDFCYHIVQFSVIRLILKRKYSFYEKDHLLLVFHRNNDDCCQCL